jgi:predicted dehydrogenase
MSKKIKLGVLGASRGMAFALYADYVGMEVVAICDTWEKRLDEANKQYSVATYTDYDRFLEHDMDAVAVANYFHQHAPAVIKALEADKHVISECIACKTPAEGVALARAVEKSGKVYLFAENYAYTAYVQEMRRLYQAGEIGEINYAEGEYNHPMNPVDFPRIAPGMNHWRNHIPPTYYCTHAMSPIMYVTDTRPVSVNAQSIAHQVAPELLVRTGDPGFVTLCRMDNGSIARLFGLGLAGHSVWYRFHGTRGLIENLRTGDTESLRVVHEPWNCREGDVGEKIYRPGFPTHAELAEKAGHGGGDFYTCYDFVEAIRKGEQPYMDVYRGLEMSLVGIQSWRSCLADGASFEIPDFRQESARAKYQNDDWSPFPEDRKPGQPLPSITGEIKPTREAIEYCQNIWQEMGYEEE